MAVLLLKTIDFTSKRLQDAAVDYREAFDEVERDIAHFKELLQQPQMQLFEDQAWKDTTAMLKQYKMDPEVPWQRGTKQSRADNPQPADPRDYFESTFYATFIQDVINTYNERFGGMTELLPPIIRLVLMKEENSSEDFSSENFSSEENSCCYTARHHRLLPRRRQR